MKMMMNCFCGTVDLRKAFSLISSRDHCQISSPSQIFEMPRAGFEPMPNLNLGFDERSCTVMITTTPQHFHSALNNLKELSDEYGDMTYFSSIYPYLYEYQKRLYINRYKSCE